MFCPELWWNASELRQSLRVIVSTSSLNVRSSLYSRWQDSLNAVAETKSMVRVGARTHVFPTRPVLSSVGVLLLFCRVGALHVDGQV